MANAYFYARHTYAGSNFYNGEIFVANEELNGIASSIPFNFSIGSLNAPAGVFPTFQDAYQYNYDASIDNVMVGVNDFFGSNFYQKAGLIEFPLKINNKFATKLTPITQTHITDAATNSPTNAETNAPTDAPTNLNVVTTLLGSLTGEVNATNARQNSIAAKVNANATKQNTLATNVNAGFAKMNAIFDALEANSILAA